MRLTVGIITSEIYSVIVIMGLLTAVFTPSLLRRTMKATKADAPTCDPPTQGADVRAKPEDVGQP